MSGEQSSQQGNQESLATALKKVLKFHTVHIPTIISMVVVFLVGVSMIGGNAEIGALNDLGTRVAGAIVLGSAVITTWRAVK